MQTLSSTEFELLQKLLKLNQHQLKYLVSNFIKRKYNNVIETDSFIIAEGDIPIALVAHLDTVFEEPPEEIFYDREKNVVFSPQGLGADDRAGVYSILRILREGLRPHIIFTTDEEIGGLGAQKVAKLDIPFKDLKYIIELDRKGSNDCVFYNCENPDFIKYVETFGFEWNFGSYSDIYDICESWGIAGTNLSIGYRDEHTYSEILFVGQMLSTIGKVKKMLLDAVNIKEPFIFIYKNSYYSMIDVVKCEHCKKYFMECEMIPVVLQNKTTKLYCGDCAMEVAWCRNCGKAYEKYSPEAPEIGLCPFCQEENK